MVKIPPIEQDGIVDAALPGAEFNVILPNGHTVRAHLSGRMRRFYINILPGDKVRLELPPYEVAKGRIVHRYKVEQIRDEDFEKKPTQFGSKKSPKK